MRESHLGEEVREERVREMSYREIRLRWNFRENSVSRTIRNREFDEKEIDGSESTTERDRNDDVCEGLDSEKMCFSLRDSKVLS
ncbi:hypothetical protein SESBI_49969 [Sesbania bispinosa]|nr:hypothetical protein SESBI_49969 [Sesbania bispinosa]